MMVRTDVRSMLGRKLFDFFFLKLRGMPAKSRTSMCAHSMVLFVCHIFFAYATPWYSCYVSVKFVMDVCAVIIIVSSLKFIVPNSLCQASGFMFHLLYYR